MARQLDQQALEHEVHQLGYRVGRWPEMDQSPDALAQEMSDRTDVLSDVSADLDERDQQDASIDPLELEPARVRGAGNEPRMPYHSDPVEERRHFNPSSSPHVLDGRASYLKDTGSDRYERHCRMAGSWRVEAANRVLGGQMDTQEFRESFLSRRPNAEMIHDVGRTTVPGQEPEWYLQAHQSYHARYVTHTQMYRVEVDGCVMDGPFSQASEAASSASHLAGKVVSQQVELPQPKLVLQQIDEAEPRVGPALAHVRADPASIAVALGVEGPSPTEPHLDPDGVFQKATRRLLAQHSQLCRENPAESRTVENGWQQTRDRLREQLPTDGGSPDAVAMLDAADDLAQYHQPRWDQLRFQTEVAVATARPGEPKRPLDRDQALRLADEAYPDLHAGIAQVDPGSPLAVRPAGAGETYDRAFRSLVEADAVAGCSWDWSMDYGGSWKMDQDVFTSQSDLVADALELESTFERSGRLVPLDPTANGPAVALDRAQAHVVAVLSALETRGVEVYFESVPSPMANLEGDTPAVVLPERWREPAPGLPEFDAGAGVSALDRLASGADRLAFAGPADTKDLFHEIGIVSMTALSHSETGFASRDALQTVRDIAGDDAVQLRLRQLEHFSTRMTASTWGQAPPAGSSTPWKAPGQLAHQTERLDQLLERAAGVEARVLTQVAARQADRRHYLQQQAGRAVEQLSQHIDGLRASGVDVKSTQRANPAYVPDERTLPRQRDRAQPSQDRIEHGPALVDARVPPRQLLVQHREFHQAVAQAVGHPSRIERQAATVVARHAAGRPVSDLQLQKATRAEAALCGAYAADRLKHSWSAPVVAAAQAKAPPELQPSQAKRFAQLSRWSREQAHAPSAPPVQRQLSAPARAVPPERSGRGRLPAAQALSVPVRPPAPTRTVRQPGQRTPGLPAPSTLAARR